MEELFALAKVLDFQLRYREALSVYDRILALERLPSERPTICRSQLHN